MNKELEDAIEKFFLSDGKWELDVNENPLPHVIGGRWLWLGDANYGFRAVDLIAAIHAALANQAKP